jgi:orotate phosphoribosyltransferase-like protein
MLYPIKVLRTKVNEISFELNRIDELFETPGDEIKRTIKKLKKRQKDLVDAVSVLTRASTIDEITLYPVDSLKANININSKNKKA